MADKRLTQSPAGEFVMFASGDGGEMNFGCDSELIKAINDYVVKHAMMPLQRVDGEMPRLVLPELMTKASPTCENPQIVACDKK